jgi:hypothetical protein
VFKADTLIPLAVKEALKEACGPLEDIPPQFKDWHPGSDGKVLDLVHPSLFPLIYGRSKILPYGKVGLLDCLQRSGDGDTIPVSGWGRTIGNAWSENYQWLPCDVRFDGHRVV